MRFYNDSVDTIDHVASSDPDDASDSEESCHSEESYDSSDPPDPPDPGCGIQSKTEACFGDFWGHRFMAFCGKVIRIFPRGHITRLSSLSTTQLASREFVEQHPEFNRSCFPFEIQKFRADESVIGESDFVCPKKIIIEGLRIEKDGSKTKLEMKFETYCGYSDKFYSYDIPYISRNYWVVG